MFAVFHRRKEIFEPAGLDPANKRVSRFVLRGHAWVFTYGINMDRDHVKEVFLRSGFVYDKLSLMPLSRQCRRRNFPGATIQRKLGGGTATFDIADGTSELPGLACLVQMPDGLRAFEEKSQPNYSAETRPIIVDARRVSAHVFNVIPNLRQKSAA